MEKRREEEKEKGIAALLIHAMYTGAAYPTELQNIEEGRIKGDPEALKQYEEIVRSYDQAVIALRREMTEALMQGEKSAEEVLIELAERQAQLAFESLERELNLPLQWSEEAKAEIQQGLSELRAELATMRPEEDPQAYEGLQKLVQLLEELLRRR